jgi:hypothetical protein
VESASKEEVPTLIYDKVNFKPKLERIIGHNILIKGAIHQILTIVNIYAMNVRSLDGNLLSGLSADLNHQNLNSVWNLLGT